MISTDEVIVGVMVDAIAAAGRRFAAAMVTLRNRRESEDMAVARWFETYRLTEHPPPLPELPVAVTRQLAEVLGGDEIQAVLHELLAVRLTDAPEADAARVRAVFEMTLSSFGKDIAQFAAALFDYYDDQVCKLVGRLEDSEPALLQQIRHEALNTRMIAILGAIERHTAALSAVPDRRADADFLARYRRHLADQHGKIEPPDFERRRRVAIADIYVSPTIVQITDGEQEHRAPREIGLWQLAEEIDRTVLLGDPGGGKTTAANVLLHHFASSDARRVPFLVTLREFATQDPPERSVVGHIEHTLETFYQCPAAAGLVDRLLLTGRAAVIFDGLDELLDASRRADVATRVERFCSEYPLARVLVTSRLVGYDRARLDDRQFAGYRLGGFGDAQINEYARKWFVQEEDIPADEAARWADAFLDESSSILDLRANPLLLSLMCILYRGEGSLPRNRAELYEQCATLLFHKWDARRRIHRELRAGHLLSPALRHLAWWLFTREQAQPAVTEDELVIQATGFLYERGFESEEDARDAAREFVEFCRGRMWVFTDEGTNARGQRLYAFTHRTFLEYFAAAYLAFQSDTPDQLARMIASHVAKNEWEVVGELAVQIKDHTSQLGAQRIYAALLGERRRRSAAGRSGVLLFLARCLQSVDPSPDTVRKLTRAVLDHLFSGNLDEPVRFLPLCWLLASSASYKYIVGEEISVRISVMVGSSDPAAHMNGLRLAASLPVATSASMKGRGPTLPWDSPLGLFWQEGAAGNVRAHAEAIIAAAAHHMGMRFVAVQYDLIEIDQAFKMGGGFLPFLQAQPMEIFGILWGSVLVSDVNWLAHGTSETMYPGGPVIVSKARRDLAAVGRYLLANPRPPWVTDSAQPWTGFNWDKPTEVGPLPTRLDPVTYLGAAATLLISTESAAIKVSSGEGAWYFGPLGDLYPYIRRRWGLEAQGKLPDLPVPEGFVQLFHDWAGGKVSVVEKRNSLATTGRSR